MTETCAAATLNIVSEVRVGSVGRPLPGTEVSIAEDGEVLMRGPLVFKGYHRNAEDTEAILEGGWLHSGDLGEIARRLRAHHRPQEGPDHHLLGQERLARDARERAARDALDLAGDRRRRPPLLPRRARHARPGRGAQARGGARRPGRPGVHGVQRPRARGRLEGHRRGQPALRPDRADQALRDPPARPLPGGGRADADAEGQAVGRLREVRARRSTRSTRAPPSKRKTTEPGRGNVPISRPPTRNRLAA